MKLVIVESPSKAKTIQKYLGYDYKVMASGGHICDLPEKTLGIDLNNNFQPRYVLNSDKTALVSRLKEAVKESDEVYLATDPDREGEAISWHLATNLGIGNECRIEFNEISAKAVKKAINSPREINMNLVDAQQARRVLDRLVGYKVSPILSQKIKNGSSGGRVQSSALKMIVDREREIRAFVPEEYWNIHAFLNKEKEKKPEIKALLSDNNKKKLKVNNGEDATKIKNLLENASYFVENVKKSVYKSRPYPPFMTSTLQQDGSIKLSMSAPQVMQLAQQLYEGIDIEGEGQTALVTYIRTDSVRVSQDMQEETLKYIKENYGDDYAPKKPNFYQSKSQNTQDAHEAIRPISLEKTPASLKDKISKNHYRLYKLIYDRFIASQMTEAVYDTMSVRIQADTKDGDNYGLKVTGRALVFKGYTVVYDNQKQDEDEVQGTLPNLSEKELLSLIKITSEQKFTKPPQRFSDASLVKAMEENGIGRPSTYASVIGVLNKREYTVKEEKAIVPTPLGEKIVDFMEHYFKNIIDISFTAGMEEKLDKVEHGLTWQTVVQDFYPEFENELIKAKGDIKMSNTHELSDVLCDKCGANMIVREGKYGKFLACPNFPKCKNVKNIVEPLGKCPDCESGQITKCFTKTGKIFYGCTNYPGCKYMSWDLPAPINCPTCGGKMKTVEVGGKKTYVCLAKECKTSVDAKDESKG